MIAVGEVAWSLLRGTGYAAASLLVLLERDLLLGTVNYADLVHILYLVVLGLIGMRIAGRRLERLLLS